MSTLELDPALALEQPRTTPGAHLRRFTDRIPLADAVAIAAIGITASALAFTNLGGGPAYQDDEGIYTAQAIAVQEGHLAPYTYWYDHPPFGWIQLGVLGFLPRVLGVGDGTDVAAMRFVVGLYFVATAILVFLIARRLTAALPFAVLASGLLIFSPLSLELGRQVYLDSIGMPWLLLAFYLALSPRMSLWHHAGAGAAFAVAVLSKLTAAIFGPALLLALIDRKGWQGRTFSIAAFLSSGALLLTFFPLMALLRGELVSGPGHVSLQDGLTYQFASREGSGYLWEAGSGRSELVSGWMSIDGFLVVAGAIAAVICLTTRQTRWILVAVASFFVPVVLSQGYLPAMYIVGGLPFLCLAIGVASHLFWRGALALARRHLPGARHSAPLLIGATLAIALLPIPLQVWVDRDTRLLTVDSNADWRATLAWMEQNLERDEVVLVPFSLHPDLADAGWDDPWTVIALEKADLDTDFALAHPNGWHEIEWVVEGPTVEPTIRYLGLEIAGDAYRNSYPVATFGGWSVRRVDG